MWLTVDRIEGDKVVLISDDETLFNVEVATLKTRLGAMPAEAQVLQCDLRGGHIRSARFDPEETLRRTQAAEERLRRLTQSKDRKV